MSTDKPSRKSTTFILDATAFSDDCPCAETAEDLSCWTLMFIGKAAQLYSVSGGPADGTQVFPVLRFPARNTGFGGDMKNLYERETVNEVISRIDTLQPAATRQWGKMDVAQMMAHCSAAIDMATGRAKPK